MTTAIDLQDKLVARFAVDPAAIEAKREAYAALSVDAPGGYEQVIQVEYVDVTENDQAAE